MSAALQSQMSSVRGGRETRAAMADESLATRVKEYCFSDSRRSVETVLALIWVLDGALQFQSFMYGKGFIQLLTGTAAGQPGWVVSSVNQGAATMESHQAIFNTLAALTQVAIGFGILYKRTTKPALLLSFAWALAVWWFGEAFGLMFGVTAMPLTGAPGSGAALRANRCDRVAQRSSRRCPGRPRRTDRMGSPMAGHGVAVAARS